MESVIIPAKTLVHIGGIPAYLAVDTIVETAYENMAVLTGNYYAHLADPPAEPPPSQESVGFGTVAEKNGL